MAPRKKMTTTPRTKKGQKRPNDQTPREPSKKAKLSTQDTETAPNTPSTPATLNEGLQQTADSPLSDLTQSPQSPLTDLLESPQKQISEDKENARQVDSPRAAKDQEAIAQENIEQEEYEEAKSLVAKAVSKAQVDIAADLKPLRNTFAKLNHDVKHWESRVNVAMQHKENGEAILAAFGHVFEEQKMAIQRYFNTEIPDQASQKQDGNPYRPYLDALIQADNSMRAAVRAAQLELKYCSKAVEDSKELAEFKRHTELAYLKTRSTLNQLQEAVRKADGANKDAQGVEVATEGVQQIEMTVEGAQQVEAAQAAVQIVEGEDNEVEADTTQEGVHKVVTAKEEAAQKDAAIKEEVQTIETVVEEVRTIEMATQEVQENGAADEDAENCLQTTSQERLTLEVRTDIHDE